MVFFFIGSISSYVEHVPGWFGIVAGITAMTGIVSSSICIVAAVVGCVQTEDERPTVPDA